MYVVIAGGGHMGSHLVTRLMAEGHEGLIVDVDARVTERLFTQKGVVTVTGSATDLSVLEQAGLKRADVAVAMMGRDADNLCFCLLARFFGVPRVLARMIDPQYEVAYGLVGATKVHNEAALLVGSFLMSIEHPQVGALMEVGRGDIVAFELRIPHGSPAAGRRVADVVRDAEFPRRCLFIGVESTSGEVEVPQGDTVIQGGSSVILAAHRPDLPQLLRALVSAPGALPTGKEALALESLRLVPFLAGLSEDDRAILAASARIETVKAGQPIFRPGEISDHMYVVRSGTVELRSPGRAAAATLRAPASFGEMSALTGHARTATATAARDAELLLVPSASLRELLVMNPILALEIAKALSTKGEGEALTG